MTIEIGFGSVSTAINPQHIVNAGQGQPNRLPRLIK